MIHLTFAQVTIGDVVIGDSGHAIEVKFIQRPLNGQVVLREQMIHKRGDTACKYPTGWPNDQIEVVNRCEVCRQRTLAHTGECMASACQPPNPNPRTYAYLHDVLDSALLRLEGAERYAQGDPLLGNALQHIRGSIRQARAAVLMSPRVRTQQEKGGQE